MAAGRWRRLRHWVQHGAFVALLFAAVALAALLARDYRLERDVTQSRRNTLSAPTLELLAQLEAPLVVKAYAAERDARGESVHRRIEEFLRPYQRASRHIELVLIDPRARPKEAADAGVRAPLELVLEYRRRSERVRELSEPALANALVRLLRGAERLVLWLDGHGERKLDGIANHDLGDFGRHLEQKGFRVAPVNLALAQDVPANAALLVIASPQVELLPAEIEKLKRHLAGGGNLLWLIDPEPLRGLQPLAEALGLVLTPGVVVDPRAASLNASPAFAVGVPAGYSRHPVTATLDRNTLFPYARQIGFIESESWRITPLIDVAQRGWVETGKIGPGVAFDRERDTPGPVTIAVAFERLFGERQQRVVVVGNGSFLANTYLGNGANLDLGVNIVNWLAGDDRLIAIQPRAAPDASLDLEPLDLYLIAFGFLVALPLGFFVAGGIVWWRRRAR